MSNGTGTIGAANITNAASAARTSPAYSVGGTVSGLSGTVVLQDNGGDNLPLTGNGPFTFATSLAGGAAYAVTVQTNPTGQTCTVSNGTGTIGAATSPTWRSACTTNGPPSASDNFNRANGSLGANWTDISDGGLAISSQVAVGAVGRGDVG